ncbi:MAG: hypothetical protein R2713_15770 [Ilumatobacteraceae bacterium]
MNTAHRQLEPRRRLETQPARVAGAGSPWPPAYFTPIWAHDVEAGVGRFVVGGLELRGHCP